MIDATITLSEAIALMRQVSRVTADKLAARDEAGEWAHYPQIARYQERPGSAGKRGSAITVCRADVEKWVEAERLKAARPQLALQRQAAIGKGLESLIPEMEAMGAHKVARAFRRIADRARQTGQV